MVSNISAEIARWFENTKHLVDRLAESAQRQEQLEVKDATLERDNEQLRGELDELRNEIQLLRIERASVAEILRSIADDLSTT